LGLTVYFRALNPVPGLRPRVKPACCRRLTGCTYDIKGNESEITSTWLVDAGDHTAVNYGALGDGYYLGTINVMPYTISTATTGGAFFAELVALHPPSSGQLTEVARAAAAWLLRNVQDNGTIPYFISPPDKEEHT
jgi:hypothetical protein